MICLKCSYKITIINSSPHLITNLNICTDKRETPDAFYNGDNKKCTKFGTICKSKTRRNYWVSEFVYDNDRRSDIYYCVGFDLDLDIII